MSEWELRVSQTMGGRESVGKGAKFLAISVREMKRLRRKMREQGVEWLLHANRGKASWNKTASEKIKQVLQFARGRYSGLNDTYLTEKVKENEKIALSRPTVRTILHQGDRGGEKARGQTSLTRDLPPSFSFAPLVDGMVGRIVGLRIN